MIDYSNSNFILRFRQAVLALLADGSMGIDEVCRLLHMSRSQVHRKVKAITGSSTSIFIRTIKLEKARDLLSQSAMTISEIAYECGIQSPQNLSKYFLLTYGVTPTQYRSIEGSIEGESSIDEAPVSNGSNHMDQRKSIAVFSFDNSSNDSEQGFLGSGIAEEISHALMKLSDIRVHWSPASLNLKNGQHNIQNIGSELNVEYCLIGSIGMDGSDIRFLVQLVDVNDGFLVWTERYEASLESIFEIQDEITTQIVDKLKVTLSPEEKESFLIERKTTDARAYQCYLKGRHEFELRNDLDLSISHFKRAIQHDPKFAHAYFGISFALIYKCIFKGASPREMLPIIEEAYESAIIINKTIPETFIIKAWIYFYFYHDIPRSITLLDRAISLDPKLVEPHRIKAYFLTFSGRYEAGLIEAKIAFDLDSNGFNPWFSLADIYRRSRKYEEAITLFEALYLEYSQIPIVSEILGLCYLHSGRVEDADTLLPLPDVYPHAISLYVLAPYFYHHHIGHTTALSGLMHYLLKEKEERYIQPSILALISFHLDDEINAISFLEEARRSLDFGLNHIVSEPYWDDYRDHPQVQKALIAVGMV